MSSENIKYIYSQSTSNGVDYMGTVLLVFLICSIFGYLYTDTQKKLLNIAWDEQKCNPRYLFFSGFFNPISKDPVAATKANFERCVSTSMYKDPELSREIKRNESYIKLHDDEIKRNLSTGQNAVEDIRNQWNNVKDKKDFEVQMSSLDSGKIFENQGFIHNIFADKTNQLFQVLKSTIIYIQGVLLYRVSKHKKDMDIDKTHENFMKNYEKTYERYKDAFKNLDNGNWKDSINIARDTIKEFNILSRDIKAFVSVHESKLEDINKSCYELKNTFEDNSCEVMFPTLLKTVDYQPIIKKSFKL